MLAKFCNFHNMLELNDKATQQLLLAENKLTYQRKHQKLLQIKRVFKNVQTRKDFMVYTVTREVYLSRPSVAIC